MRSILNSSRLNLYKGTIPCPSRSTKLGVIIILSVFVILSLMMVSPGRMSKAAHIGLAALLPTAIASRSVHAVHLSIFGLIWISLLRLFPSFHVWPLYILTPLIAYGIVISAFSPLRRSVTWMRIGNFGRDIRTLVYATVIISSTALVIWCFLAKPDLRSHLALIPDMPLWVYPMAALGFASLNAAMEEILFRGIMMEALDSSLGIGYASVIIQAVSFASLHYLAGFPYGPWGFAMVLVYGVLLGILRRRSQGLFAPWVAHVIADITIFGILAILFIKQ